MTASAVRAPVFFLGHGGPPILEWTHHTAYSALKQFGKAVTDLSPKGIIVFSAHWSGTREGVYINEAESTDLIYDFYGFPKSYYQMKFPHKGSAAIAGKVSQLLKEAGIQHKGVSRGLDHGVWVPFKIAFDKEENPLKSPIVQISIYGNEDPEKHLALGRAVEKLRDEGYIIIGSGATVHNLRDMDFDDARPLGYTKTFDGAVEEAVTGSMGEDREEKMVNLLKRGDARKAHPHFDHLLPIYVAVGAAKGAKGKLIFNHQESSLSWSQYRFDEA